MTVYVDDRKDRYQQLITSRMFANDEAELHRMAATIGVERRWYREGYYRISQFQRLAAIRRGAQPVRVTT